MKNGGKNKSVACCVSVFGQKTSFFFLLVGWLNKIRGD